MYLFQQQWKKTMAISVAILLVHLMDSIPDSIPGESDKITELPGQPKVRFQQYSGYIAVDDKKERALFYYFVEAEIDPISKPLVLWFNGGPGCSSLGVGAFSENGPFRPNAQVLLRNQHSWNKEANMLYLEAPVGVGFSYSSQTSFQTVDDKITARDNLLFLKAWLQKFPQYKQRELYLTGESYAGHYIPQLAELIIEFNKKKMLFNLKGIALGNPVLEFATDFNSRAEYMWSHGLISDSTYKLFTSTCNYSRYVSDYYRGSVSPICSTVMSQVSKETSRFVDKYDVTLDVCISSVFSQSRIINPQQQVTENVDVCIEDEIVNYLNRRDVQKALHARLVGVNRWTVCSNVLDYDVLNVETPTINVVGRIVKAGILVLVYSGDQDSVIPLTGSRKLVHGLAQALRLNITAPYRVWFQGKQPRADFYVRCILSCLPWGGAELIEVRAGIVGYPNVGKSSIINRLLKRRMCPAAPRPGVTRVLKWVRFGKDLELLDSPGILPMRISDQGAAMELAICDDIGERSYDVADVAAILVQMLAKLPTVGSRALYNRYKIDAEDYCGKVFVEKLAMQLFNGDVNGNAIIQWR